jgi:phage gpG-like protein
VKVEDERARAVMAGIANRINNAGPFMALTATQMHRDIIQSYNREQGPTGRWKAWTPNYAKRRGPGKILVGPKGGGQMRGSIRFANGRNYAEVGIFDGPALDYAGAHQYGNPKGHLPKRTFIWLSQRFWSWFRPAFRRWVTEGV